MYTHTYMFTHMYLCTCVDPSALLFPIKQIHAAFVFVYETYIHALWSVPSTFIYVQYRTHVYTRAHILVLYTHVNIYTHTRKLHITKSAQHTRHRKFVCMPPSSHLSLQECPLHSGNPYTVQPLDAIANRPLQIPSFRVSRLRRT